MISRAGAVKHRFFGLVGPSVLRGKKGTDIIVFKVNSGGLDRQRWGVY